MQKRIEEFLKIVLRLELHPDKITIRKYSQGVDFLGYITLPHARVLRTKTKRRIMKKLRKRIREYKKGIITETSLNQTISSYLGVLGHANSHKLEERIRPECWESIKNPDV